MTARVAVLALLLAAACSNRDLKREWLERYRVSGERMSQTSMPVFQYKLFGKPSDPCAPVDIQHIAEGGVWSYKVCCDSETKECALRD